MGSKAACDCVRRVLYLLRRRLSAARIYISDCRGHSCIVCGGTFYKTAQNAHPLKDYSALLLASSIAFAVSAFISVLSAARFPSIKATSIKSSASFTSQSHDFYSGRYKQRASLTERKPALKRFFIPPIMRFFRRRRNFCQSDRFRRIGLHKVFRL